MIALALSVVAAGAGCATAEESKEKTTGLLANVDELAGLPASGPAWDAMLAVARAPLAKPDLADMKSPANVAVLARALVHARTGEAIYRDEVVEACRRVIGSQGGKTLALARELAAYVIAADLVGLPAELDADFRSFLREVRHQTLTGRTLITTHERRANNWGTHAGASRLAVAIYLGDDADVERAARVFRGWLGERGAYAGFRFGKDLSWQAGSGGERGINPKGATIEGHPVDGVIPDDQRRGGSFRWPPPKEPYAWEALQGAVLQAILLTRQGYEPFEWSDRALLRAVRWLHDIADFPAEGDDRWLPHVINHFYGTDFPAPVPAQPGKNFGWTDWLYRAP